MDIFRCDRVNPLFMQERTGAQKFKIGHAGTLDPLATGLLILCCGPATKRIEEFKNFDKEYTGTFSIGATTASFDLEKPIDEFYPIDHITEEKIYEAAEGLTGVIMQVPQFFRPSRSTAKEHMTMPARIRKLKLLPAKFLSRNLKSPASHCPKLISGLFAAKGPISVR